MLRKIIIVVVILAIGIGGMMFFTGQKKERNFRPRPKQAPYVGLQTVNNATINSEISATGRISSGTTIEVVAQAAGTFKGANYPLKEGVRFARGKTVFQIVDRESKLNLNAQRSQFLTNIANILPDIQLDYKSEHQKWQQYFDAIDVEKNLPEFPETKSAQEKVFLAGRGILNQYYSIKAAEERFAKQYFVAPFSGSIVELLRQENSIVTIGTPLARVASSDQLELIVPVSAQQAKFIQIGNSVDVEITGTNSSVKGRVSRIGNTIEAATQSIEVYITLNNTSGAAKAGAYATANIIGKPVDEAIQIPRKALIDDAQVYLFQDSIMRLSAVNVISKTADHAIIQGLKNNQKVVVDIPLKAQNGMKVRDAAKANEPKPKSTKKPATKDTTTPKKAVKEA